VLPCIFVFLDYHMQSCAKIKANAMRARSRSRQCSIQNASIVPIQFIQVAITLCSDKNFQQNRLD